MFDSHAHYDDAQFDADREELLGRVLPEKGVCGILNMGADLKGCKDTVALTERYEYLYGAVGIHPECARELPDNWLNLLREWLKCEKIVAVGEIGLDYHWLEECPKERQKKVFSAQLELAEELSLPVIIHDREAHADTLEFLQRYRPSGVVHCFSGSVETAREILKLGMYIGLGGAVTFKNARHSVEVAREISLERLLLETDAPYMAPVPFRGKRNDSSLIAYVAEKIGEIRGIPAEAVLHVAAENTRRLFGIA
ncbi:TatD family hydrolase [Neglectibacter timonensis]|uniref:TatD family hydrolase n=1 Tax=Neglectibacter timonensis TaxID=1776382 RepID=UPI003D2B85E8